MDARCPGQLGQTADRILHLSGCYHHQVRQLVHDNDDLWHFFWFVFVRNILDGFHFLIITLQVTDVIFRELLVSAGHLRHSPV